MSTLDFAILGLYFVVVLGIGFWYQRQASKDLDSYFLGGKRMHWLALAMSGSVATFDITGTMWIVTLLTLFGMKSMWNHWMWGFLMAAFFMSYMGKWVRRSNVMTGAEWMVTRFGDRSDGRVARLSYSLMAIVFLTGLIGYAFQGIGKFAAVYIPLERLPAALEGVSPELARWAGFFAEHEVATLAIAVFTLTTLYVLLGGLYSVVITNVIQTVILTAASVLIAGVAYVRLSPEKLAAALPDGWTSLSFAWRLSPGEVAAAGADYAVYELFGLMVVVWVAKGLLLNLGGPGQMTDFQIFLSTRNARDASKLGAAWSAFLVARWAMCIGIALLALTGLAQSSDPEQVMPLVLREYLPTGVRGLVIAGLLAAFMSTFSATVNAAASYVIRDLWQPLFASAGQRRLVRASYVATVAVVAAGIAIGFNADSIRQVWDWIMMAIGAAFVVPNVLRWYWWRLNGWGYAVGTLTGLIGAISVPFLPSDPGQIAAAMPGLPPSVAWCLGNAMLPYVQFPILCGLSIVGCLAATWLTRPTDERVLVAFYDSVRPFGLWGRIRKQSQLSAEELAAPSEGLGLTALNVALSATAILGAYLAPMYFVGHWYGRSAAWLAAAVSAGVALYFTWYRSLPKT